VSLRAHGSALRAARGQAQRSNLGNGGRLPDVGFAPRDISIVVLLTGAIAVFTAIRDAIWFGSCGGVFGAWGDDKPGLRRTETLDLDLAAAFAVKRLRHREAGFGGHLDTLRFAAGFEP